MKIKTSQFVDTTLRDGDQAAGLGFSFAQKKNIFSKLIDSGFTHIEAGYPAALPEEIPWLKSVVGSIKGTHCITVWARAVEGDIISARKAETGAIHIAFPGSQRLLETVGWHEEELEERLSYFVRKIRGEFNWVSVGLMDAFRMDKQRVELFIREAKRLKVDRIRLSDTVGTAYPAQIAAWSEQFRFAQEQLEFHGHNDLGMATANSITALHSGFGAVSGTLAGLGERAGNASWDQILFALETALGSHVPFDLKELVQASRLAADFCGEKISDSQPILGKRAFAHATGIHQAALEKDKLSFQPFLPEDFGLGEMTLLGGGLSGRKGIATMLKQNGIIDLQEHLDPFISYLKGRDGERDMTRSRLAQLYNDFIQGVF